MTLRFDRTRLLGAELSAFDRERRARAIELAERAIAAVDPYGCTREAIARFGEDLDGATVFAFGKASAAMARAACETIDLEGGIAITLAPIELPGLEVHVGSHPAPASDAERTGRAVLARALSLGAGDRALCLVSGGGSAMLELPKKGVSMATIERISRELMRRGADIGELNAVRRSLSELKGGGLARAIAPAAIFNVVISDVPGHEPAIVASGPTFPPPEDDPREILERYELWQGLDARTMAAVLEPRSAFELDVRTEIAADNAKARRAVSGELTDRDGVFGGEARELGARIASETHERGWIWGGESTVTVRGSGRGGRNQELLLGALRAGWSRGLLLALGTDGVDGSSDAAGALIDPPAVRAARGLDAARALEENDSHAFFDALGTQLRCGPTGTNVADLCLYLP